MRGAGAPALAFVHGWSCDRSYWNGQLGYFARRHQVVAVDLAGHGESGVGRHAWTIPAFGDDVLAVVDQLGLEALVLVGHSMGGDVIVEAGLHLPGRVVGLVCVDMYSSLGEPLTPEEIQAFLGPLREDFVTKTRALVRGMFVPSSDPALVDRVAADMSAAPPDIALDSAEHSFRNDRAILDNLRAVDGAGCGDQPRLPADRRRVAPALRHEDRAHVRRRHFLMMEDPDAFNRILDETIEGFAG